MSRVLNTCKTSLKRSDRWEGTAINPNRKSSRLCQCSEERCGSAFAGDIAQGKPLVLGIETSSLGEVVSLSRMVKSLHRANVGGAASFQFANVPLGRGSEVKWRSNRIVPLD